MWMCIVSHRYTSRAQAVKDLIVTPIKGVGEDPRDYYVNLIADDILDTRENGYCRKVGEECFWKVVQGNKKEFTLIITTSEVDNFAALSWGITDDFGTVVKRGTLPPHTYISDIEKMTNVVSDLSGYPLNRVGHIDEVWYIGSQLMWTINIDWKENSK